MAAPMDIPKHHRRQELCLSRAPYRDGRQPTAVKVYTINQESTFLLVQGVPALGTSQELIKLFAIHGVIEEYQLLDQYPSTDQFTDVYLFKFKKIQSARFAKKKLDDWAFFGGILHVSYAPEFESVEETRLKLQDRRRLIASRIRLHEREAEKLSNSKHESYSGERPNDSDQGERLDAEKFNLQSQAPGGSRNSELLQKSSNIHNAPMNYSMETKSENNWTNAYGEAPKLLVPHTDTTWIPPPPRQQYSQSVVTSSNDRSDYPYARVPSAHATLPKQLVHVSEETWSKQSNFQECYTNVDTNVHPSENSKSKQRSAAQMIKSDSNRDRISNANGQKGSESFEKQNATGQKERKKEEKIINGLVIREFNVKKSRPKFIPRQAMNLLKKKDATMQQDVIETQGLDKELKRNAFLLGKPQGPGCREKESSITAEEKSVQKSREDIRKRVVEDWIQKFCREWEQEFSKRGPTDVYMLGGPSQKKQKFSPLEKS